MKKIFLIFTFLIAFGLSSVSARANSNYLHTITLEKNNTGYNVFLDADKSVKVSKTTPSDKELILELNGITSAEGVNALYRGINSIEGLVVENTAPNKVKVYITADNISNSTIFMNTASGEQIVIGENIPTDKLLWIAFAIAILAVIFKMSKKIAEEDRSLIKKSIKDREIELYRNYQAQMAETPTIHSYRDIRMKKMLKKIDRKIDERLSMSVK